MFRLRIKQTLLNLPLILYHRPPMPGLLFPLRQHRRWYRLRYRMFRHRQFRPSPSPGVQPRPFRRKPHQRTRQRLRRQQRPRHLRLHPKPLLNLWHRAKHRSLKLPQNVFPVLLRTEKTGKILLISTRTTDLRSVSSVPVTRKNLEISWSFPASMTMTS